MSLESRYSTNRYTTVKNQDYAFSQILYDDLKHPYVVTKCTLGKGLLSVNLANLPANL